MNNLWNRMPLFAPGGNEGGGGGGEIQEDDPLELSEDDLNLDNDDDMDALLEGNADGLDDEDGINLAKDSFLDTLFEPEEADPDDNSGADDELDAGDSPEAQKLLADNLKAAIAGLSIPEAAIPADFDPTDSKQMRDVLGAIQKQTVQETMKIMWQPIAAAMQQTIVRLRAEINSKTDTALGEDRLQTMLTKAIPAYGTSRGVKSLADTVLAKAKVKYKGDNTKIVAATRKALVAAGIPIHGKPGGGGQPNGPRGTRPTSAASRTNSVLDQFAKLPTRVSTQPNARLANRMQNGK